MRLPFVNRQAELSRIGRALSLDHNALVCIYGRRRLGKSRLLQQALANVKTAVYHVCDQRDAPVQRGSLAREVGRLLPGFDAVTYPTWEALLERWQADAPARAVLALDEFPYLVSAAPELPSLLQKMLDRPDPRARKLVLCGSSQRMMMGLLLDAAAPLYGRARELIRLEPLDLRWLPRCVGVSDPALVVEHHAVWGGVPRYWELAAEHDSLWSAVSHLILDPLGVLYREPATLLLDDLRETARAASLLALIGQGCHRPSELAGRLEVPATTLSRPLARLCDLGLVARELPFGAPPPRKARRSLYKVADPLLAFWYRFVDPNRSRLEAGQLDVVLRDVQQRWPQYLGGAWERLARHAVARIPVRGRRWGPASRWWGQGTDRWPMELDLIATAADDPSRVLLGEVKLAATTAEARRWLAALEERARRCPPLGGKQVEPCLWVLRFQGDEVPEGVVTAAHVVDGDAQHP